MVSPSGCGCPLGSCAGAAEQMGAPRTGQGACVLHDWAELEGCSATAGLTQHTIPGDPRTCTVL